VCDEKDERKIASALRFGFVVWTMGRPHVGRESIGGVLVPLLL